jgi:hypothetical protein
MAAKRMQSSWGEGCHPPGPSRDVRLYAGSMRALENPALRRLKPFQDHPHPPAAWWGEDWGVAGAVLWGYSGIGGVVSAG